MTIYPCAASAIFFIFGVAHCAAQELHVEPAKMKRIGTVDERFQSFNVEMVEVTGGRFWAPYKSGDMAAAEAVSSAKLATPGLDPSLFSTRKPIDLSNPRLRTLAAALGPAYMRVSGTWANSTYFHDADSPAPAAPPIGFGGLLTRTQWKGVINFSRATDSKIVTSFAISQGVRDAKGTWTPDQARKLVAFTKSAGAEIAAAEFFNEPTMALMGGAPKGYDAAAYGRDMAAFLSFARKTAPEMLVLGPGSLGEAGDFAEGLNVMTSEDMLRASGRGLDAFSYHYYGGVSKRCAAIGPQQQTNPDVALTAEWLDRTARDLVFYAKLRDRFEPGKPIWLTETGETACGGNPWASTFIDSFRYLNQLGLLAKQGVQVVAHNTLAASDYALIDEETWQPRPNYWSALLWRKLMGKTVLDAGASPSPQIHVYAHCLRDHSGGVALLAINADEKSASELNTSAQGESYALTSPDGLLARTVALNGKTLEIGADDRLPAMKGKAVRKGKVALAPVSITFLAFPRAANEACR